jgi:hypothetical protein
VGPGITISIAMIVVEVVVVVVEEVADIIGTVGTIVDTNPTGVVIFLETTAVLAIASEERLRHRSILRLP